MAGSPPEWARKLAYALVADCVDARFSGSAVTPDAAPEVLKALQNIRDQLRAASRVPETDGADDSEAVGEGEQPAAALQGTPPPADFAPKNGTGGHLS